MKREYDAASAVEWNLPTSEVVLTLDGPFRTPVAVPESISAEMRADDWGQVYIEIEINGQVTALRAATAERFALQLGDMAYNWGRCNWHPQRLRCESPDCRFVRGRRTSPQSTHTGRLSGDERLQVVLELRDQGMGVRQIAESLSWSESTIRGDLGKSHPPPTTADF